LEEVADLELASQRANKLPWAGIIAAFAGEHHHGTDSLAQRRKCEPISERVDYLNIIPKG